MVGIRRIANGAHDDHDHATPCHRPSNAAHRVFLHLLVNTLLVSVINFTVWFAITFWVFLETRSVLATGMVAGIFLVATALSGIWFGSLVDHNRKKRVMQASTLVSLALYTWRVRCSTSSRPRRSSPTRPACGCGSSS